MSPKNYVVLGGSKGIGLATVHKLLHQGHLVTVVSRSAGLLPEHPSLKYVSLDIVQESLDQDLLPDVIDGLVYCPGSIVLKPFKSISDGQYIEDFQINCLGAVRSIKSALAGLKKSENNPSAVLFSTIAVQQGMAFHASIAAAKGAVEGITRSLAAELAPSIRVNCIAPSLTDTDLAAKLLSSPEKKEAAALRHPLKSIGRPEDIASMVSFLLSEEAKWITGQIIHMDGGMSSVRV